MTIKAEILSGGRFLNTGRKDTKEIVCETGVPYDVTVEAESIRERFSLKLEDFGAKDKGGSITVIRQGDQYQSMKVSVKGNTDALEADFMDGHTMVGIARNSSLSSDIKVNSANIKLKVSHTD